MKYGYEEIAFQLLEHGANPRQNIVRDQIMYTPLYFAISAKSVRCAQKLLEMGADASLIHGPWVIGHAKKTSALHLSAELDAADQYSYTYYFDDLDLLELLLRYNCVHSGATEGAFRNKQFETCALLLNAGLNSLPPAYFPRLIGYGIEWVRLFYKHMDLAYTKETLLQKAIAASALDIVEYLLQQGETSPWALDFCKTLDCLKLVVSYLGITEEQKGRLVQNAIKNNADDILDYLLNL